MALPLKVSHLPSSTPCPLRCNPALRLSAAGPHTLEVAVPLGEPVHAVVALAHRAHETAQGVGLVLAGVAAVLVNVADRDLGGGVVGGLDDAVRRGALAGDVTFRRDRLSVCAFPGAFLLWVEVRLPGVGWPCDRGVVRGSLTGRPAHHARSPF